MTRARNPVPTVDVIIEVESGIVLIERKNPPAGWALPGGFVDYGESLEQAAVREAREETGLEVTLLGQLHTYSDPARDPRQHTITTVFVGRAAGEPRAGDDAGRAEIVPAEAVDRPLAFDHRRILDDYLAWKSGRQFMAEEHDSNAPPRNDPPDEQNLVEISRVQGSAEAEVIKSLLDSQGIRSLIRGQIAQIVYPFTTDGLGELRILVPARDAGRARELLAGLPEPPDDGLEAPDDGEDRQP